MTKDEFIEKCEKFLEQTGMSEGAWNSFMSVGDDPEINTSILIDGEGFLWIAENESVKRLKTTVNIANVEEFRYSQFGRDEGRFFIICKDFSGLDFCEGEVYFFQDGKVDGFVNAVKWFEEHPVG